MSLSPRRGLNKDMKNGHNDIAHRLQITQGHLKKVIEMNKDGAYCIDLLHQLQAIRAALGKVESKVLENHLNGCVRDAFKKGEQKKAIEEVLSVFDKTR